jgi:RNA:NAD 2'-phosphotransferase (TPT1/KptA family)
MKRDEKKWLKHVEDMKKNEMRLFHSTKVKNMSSILKDGLIATLGYVYMTPDLEHAKKLGNLVFEIDWQKLDPKYLGTYREMICDIMKTDDYWHYGNNIPPQLLKLLIKNN